MKKPRALMISACLALIALAAVAQAHSTVKATIPRSGAVLTASPPEVVIELNEEARLTSLVVVAPDGDERKLTFEPTGSARRFTASSPALTNGRSEIQWKALSKDGHPISGKIIVVIKPAR
jgi:copper resistance protein C